MTHYEALELENTASSYEIKLAYRKLVKKYHPDINPSEEARVKILLVNEAYEILSNPTSRNLYDLYLEGVPVKTVLDEVTPQQRYKDEYLRNKIRQQRERMEQQIRYKHKFYRYFRMINVVCFAVSIVFSYDYYFDSGTQVYEADKVVAGRTGTVVFLKQGGKVETSKEFYPEYVNSDEKTITICFSSILKAPRTVRPTGSEKDFRVKGSFYAFNNAFSIILFVFSIIVVGNRHYSDFRLTCGLISFMTLLWLLILAAPYY